MLDKKIIGSLTLERCLFIGVFLIAIATRLYIAGVRPEHHDESIHAFYSWKIVTNGLGNYQYDPVYHGPVLYYWTALCFWLFGDSDFVARVSPVIFGLGLIAFAWPLRRYMGRWGAIAYLLLLTFSPAMNYFTRFLRHDVYVAFFCVATVFFGFEYGRTRKAWNLYIAVASLSLAFCTKEDMYALGPLFIICAIFMMVWEVVYAEDWKSQLRESLQETGQFLRGAILPMITASVIFVVIWLIFYTSFGNHPDNWNGVTKALSYWWGQHEIQRIGGPWWYYLPQMALYEQLILFPAIFLLLIPLLRPRKGEGKATYGLSMLTLAAFIAFFGALFAIPERAPVVLLGALGLAGLMQMRRWLPSRFLRFCIIWTIGSVTFYSWAQEKVPWLLMPVLMPMIFVAAMWFAQMIEERRILKPIPALLLSVFGAFTLWSFVAGNYLYDAPRPDEDPEQRTGELLAYVQSTYDIHKVMDRIEEIGDAMGTGEKTRLAVSGNATWPLSWYLRHYPVNWAPTVRKVDTPVVIVDKEVVSALDEPLKEKYDKIPFQIRGWWEPNYRLMTAGNFMKYLFTRQVFSPVGSSDAVMYALKDPKPGVKLAAIEVNPPPPAKGYVRGPSQFDPIAVLGGQGSGKGYLNEPRGMSVDSSGNLYVADSKNHRIHKFAAAGSPLKVWGKKGDGEGEFNDPCGIAISSDGFVYVADTWNHRVQKFDLDGNFLRQWSAEPSFWGPRGIAVSPDGQRIYLTDTGNKKVFAYDPDGQELARWGEEGSKNGEIIEPVGIAVDDEGQVYVADTGNRRVQVFDPDGKFVKVLSVSGWEEFYSEPYLAISGPDLFVTDSYNHRAARYRDGQLIYSWGTSGSGNGEFNRPIGIAVDSQGLVYVADTLNHRIQQFNLPDEIE